MSESRNGKLKYLLIGAVLIIALFGLHQRRLRGCLDDAL